MSVLLLLRTEKEVITNRLAKVVVLSLPLNQVFVWNIGLTLTWTVESSGSNYKSSTVNLFLLLFTDHLLLIQTTRFSDLFFTHTSRQTHLDHRWLQPPQHWLDCCVPWDPPKLDAPNLIIPDTNRCQLHNTFNIISTYSLSQTVHQPTQTQTMTHSTGHGDSPYQLTTSHTLDLFLTDNILNITNFWVVPGICDYDMLIINTDFKLVRQRQRPRQIYLHSRADLDLIKQYLTAFSTDFLLTNPHTWPLPSHRDNLKNAIHTAINRYIPQKTLSCRCMIPWVARDLHKQHSEKQTLQKCADIQHNR